MSKNSSLKAGPKSEVIKWGFTLKWVRDMIRTYNQMHRTDKYSQHNWLSIRLQTKWLWVQVQ